MEMMERRISYFSMILFLFFCFSSCSNKEQLAQKHFKKGFEYHNQGALDKAVEEYREALKLNPGFVEVYMNLGAIYVDKKDYDQALQQFKKAVELNYYNTKGHYNLGMVYVYRGEKEKAEAELKILKSFGSSLADNLEKKIAE
jgi:Flp pilus assembly protein TadD